MGESSVSALSPLWSHSNPAEGSELPGLFWKQGRDLCGKAWAGQGQPRAPAAMGSSHGRPEETARSLSGAADPMGPALRASPALGSPCSLLALLDGVGVH